MKDVRCAGDDRPLNVQGPLTGHFGRIDRVKSTHTSHMTNGNNAAASWWKAAIAISGGSLWYGRCPGDLINVAKSRSGLGGLIKELPIGR
jgi:hypothetical protein